MRIKIEEQLSCHLATLVKLSPLSICHFHIKKSRLKALSIGCLEEINHFYEKSTKSDPNAGTTIFLPC